MFGSDSEDDTFEQVAPKRKAAPQKFDKRRRRGNKTEDEDSYVVEESVNSVLTPNISIATPNVSLSAANSSHPAFNGSDAAAHSTPTELHLRKELEEAKQKKRSFVADTLAQMSSVINDDQEEAWQLAQESQTSSEAAPESLHLQQKQKQQPYEIAGACFDIKLSSEQLSEHLANCIQLNAANKINKNNAFNLQLIDYMFVLLRRNDKTMQDFPTMSCSLDASTRIYACRVDSVHAGIMEIVSGLTRAGDKNKKKLSKDGDESGGEENSDGEGEGDNEQQQKARVRKRKSVIASSLDALCRTKIETASWMQRPAIQPDFTNLLTQASVTHGDDYRLTLLQDDIKLVPPRRSKQTTSQTDRSKQIVSVPFDLIPTTCDYDYDFGFSWSDGDDGDDASSADVINDDHDCTMNDYSFNVHDNTVISDVSHRNSNFPAAVEVESIEVVKEGAASQNKESVVNDVDVDEVVMNESFGGDDHDESGEEEEVVVVEPNKKRHDTLSLVSTKALLGEGDSCYSYIDSDLLPDVWVGPDFWKPKFKRGKPVACQLAATEKAVEKKTRRKTKRTDLLSFEEDLSNVFEVFDTKSDKAANDRMIKKWSEKKLTLPGKKNCKMQDVYRSFLRKNLFYKPFLKPDKNSPEARIQYEYADDGEHIFSNENNKIGDIDGDMGISMNNDNNQSDCDDYNDDHAEEPVENVEDDDDDDGNADEGGSSDVFNAENLVPMPKLVECDAIKYATVPKRLDMKKLKTTIWSMLDLEDDKENKSQKSSESKKDTARTFSDIYRQLPDRLSGEMRKDMSPALAFLAILHLTNEKTLSIESADSALTDFVIRNDSSKNSSP